MVHKDCGTFSIELLFFFLPYPGSIYRDWLTEQPASGLARLSPGGCCSNSKQRTSKQLNTQGNTQGNTGGNHEGNREGNTEGNTEGHNPLEKLQTAWHQLRSTCINEHQCD